MFSMTYLKIMASPMSLEVVAQIMLEKGYLGRYQSAQDWWIGDCVWIFMARWLYTIGRHYLTSRWA